MFSVEHTTLTHTEDIMKITVSKTTVYDVRTYEKYEEELEIDPALLAQIENGEHPDYDTIEDWAVDQDIDFVEITDSWQGHSEEIDQYWEVEMNEETA